MFGIRTITEGDSPEEADARRTRVDGVAEFGVLCSTVSRSDARSHTTTLHMRGDTTYRDVNRVLAVIEGHTGWKRKETNHPADVAPGFLTALDHMMRAGAVSARIPAATPRCPRLAYIYKDAVYDLVPRRVEPLSQLKVRGGVFHNLLRTEVAVVNRATQSTTTFSITYGTEGALAGVPVSIRFQPNWWLRVELELDEQQQVPADPAMDPAVRQRIASLCGEPSTRGPSTRDR